MKATIIRDRDLVGATPEKLARALLRNQLRPRSGILSSSGYKPLYYPPFRLTSDFFDAN